ncbi:MAG: DNA-3-methyladenine glycosylase 2 family protein [Candidatus Levybacteria bacterium]|nr:DNA-3-methyladenine glycosylase 2 family protein [Candidatus Levybacteria bacterium]
MAENHLLQKIKNHFKKVDIILYASIKDLYPLEKASSKDYFKKLCGEIINQQLSDKASATIYERFQKLYPDRRITPEYTTKLTHEEIRAAGTSNAKARFIKSLAQKVVNKELEFEKLDNMTDEEAIRELTKIKGIGPWTAEMFIMFSLARQDVFSHGDLGLRKAIKKLYGFRKEPTRKQIEKISKKWSPYRTYACAILWQVNDKTG